ncbi:MAG: hypothetical protein ACK53L_13100, partial [Pirellulaceae bacterium]
RWSFHGAASGDHPQLPGFWSPRPGFGGLCDGGGCLPLQYVGVCPQGKDFPAALFIAFLLAIDGPRLFLVGPGVYLLIVDRLIVLSRDCLCCAVFAG